jgi:NADPH:quinone reductase-like Zn-dependent oxidoreductase
LPARNDPGYDAPAALGFRNLRKCRSVPVTYDAERSPDESGCCRSYGPPEVVEIAEVPRPRPGPKDVLIKTRATTVSAADWRLRTGTVPPGFGLFLRVAVGFTGPRDPILGTDVAGEVAAVGQSVSRFRPGAQVFAAKMGSCHAEYVAVNEDAVAPWDRCWDR